MTRKLLCGKPRISINKHGTIKCDQHHIDVQCPKRRSFHKEGAEMSVDDLEVGTCPLCGGEMINYGSYSECEDCGYKE
jgi:hypothetical protein